MIIDIVEVVFLLGAFYFAACLVIDKWWDAKFQHLERITKQLIKD